MFKIDLTDKSDLFLDSTVQEVDHGKLYYMKDTLESIKNIDIKNFNYIVFEEDLDNMYKSEFNEFFDELIVPLIDNLNQYIFIDLELVIDEPYRVKQLFVKNIIRFFMNTLPYIYMKEFIKGSEAEGLHDALELFDDNLKTKIVTQIESNTKQYTNFNTMMGDIEETITNEKKKIKFAEKLTLLEHNMTNKLKLLDYYASIINNSGNDGLKDLFKIYLKNDLDNLL